MADLLHTTTRRQLADLLTNFANSKPADTSFALVFVGGALPTAEVTAIKEAVKICDVVVAVWLPVLARPQKSESKVIPPGASYQSALEKLGVDIFALLPEDGVGCHIKILDKRMTISPATTTTLMQSLTTVLPNVTVIPRVHTQINQTCRKLIHTFGYISVIRNV